MLVVVVVEVVLVVDGGCHGGELVIAVVALVAVVVLVVLAELVMPIGLVVLTPVARASWSTSAHSL